MNPVSSCAVAELALGPDEVVVAIGFDLAEITRRRYCEWVIFFSAEQALKWATRREPFQYKLGLVLYYKSFNTDHLRLVLDYAHDRGSHGCASVSSIFDCRTRLQKLLDHRIDNGTRGPIRRTDTKIREPAPNVSSIEKRAEQKPAQPSGLIPLAEFLRSRINHSQPTAWQSDELYRQVLAAGYVTTKRQVAQVIRRVRKTPRTESGRLTSPRPKPPKAGLMDDKLKTIGMRLEQSLVGLETIAQDMDVFQKTQAENQQLRRQLAVLAQETRRFEEVSAENERLKRRIASFEPTIKEVGLRVDRIEKAIGVMRRIQSKLQR